MRLINVLVTLLSGCCCISILNLFSFGLLHELKPKLIQTTKAILQNYSPTNEEILKCRNATRKTFKDLDKTPTQEEAEESLARCIQFLRHGTNINKDENNFDKSPSSENNGIQQPLQRNSENNLNKSPPSENHDIQLRSIRKDENNFNKSPYSENHSIQQLPPIKDEKNSKKSPPSGNYNIEQHESITKVQSTITRSKEGSDRDAGVTESINKTSRRENASNSNFNRFSGEHKESKMIPTQRHFESTTEGPRFWSYLFRSKDSTSSSHGNRFVENSEKDLTPQPGEDFVNSTDLGHLTTEVPVWNFVMPGTKWCGSGSIAKNDDDLGYFADVDSCCRAHDKCDDYLLPGETKNNLTNASPFTALHCECDDELYECLSKLDSPVAYTVGNTFFNIFRRKCFMFDYPRKCKKQKSLLGCLEYEIDKTAEKIYQWIPAKQFVAKVKSG